MNVHAMPPMNHRAMSRNNMTRPEARPCGNARERGMALVMSLVILMILTLLGITAMGTSSLEEKMSGNTQEGARAFEVAESGLQRTLSDATQFVPSGPPVTSPKYSTNGRVAQVTTTWLQATQPPRGSGNQTGFMANHFQQASVVSAQVDSANIGLNTTNTRGVIKLAPPSE
jgi:Tfp pilus assembly protein PilX